MNVHIAGSCSPTLACVCHHDSSHFAHTSKVAIPGSLLGKMTRWGIVVGKRRAWWQTDINIYTIMRFPRESGGEERRYTLQRSAEKVGYAIIP